MIDLLPINQTESEHDALEQKLKYLRERSMQLQEYSRSLKERSREINRRIRACLNTKAS